MSARIFAGTAVTLTLLTKCAVAATLYVSPASVNPTSPYGSWNTAANDIQTAIDAANPGDVVMVTNGVYASGGAVMAGDLTNRVALYKAITVQSVNGPLNTVIWGAGTTNGTTALRCAWLTNGATLSGFTLTGGGTRTSGAVNTLEYGGGAWCYSTTALLVNCIISSNTAVANAGVYQGALENCLLAANSASQNYGAGSGGIYNNCSIISNISSFGSSILGRLTNSIVYYNGDTSLNGSSGARCCTSVTLSGTGNFTNSPQLLPDGLHLANASPCRGTGTNALTTTDLFGQPWGSPPSIGCCEWLPTPSAVTTIQPSGFPPALSFQTVASGLVPLTFVWSKDGVALQDGAHYQNSHSSNLVVLNVGPADAGNYQLIVSNSAGILTNTTPVTIRCVDVNGNNPSAPYLSWGTAANTLQDCVASSVAGDILLVTNGVYSTGGIAMAGNLTNRVTLDRPVKMLSMNGPTATIILGAGATNGSNAVRGAWLTNGALLSGFTITGGATQISGDIYQARSGGGVWLQFRFGNRGQLHHHRQYGGCLWRWLLFGNL